MSEALLGVDVGFSATGKSTGLAWRVGTKLDFTVIGSTREQRRAALPCGIRFDLVAMDAPLVPGGAKDTRRRCEDVFYRGAFWNRCRPGLSHYGRGQKLRVAGADAAKHFAGMMQSGSLEQEAIPGEPIVEAFPNTFLGVLLPEETFKGWPPAKKKPKSDWLYDKAVLQGVFRRLLADLGWTEDGILDRFATVGNHDVRAALICLLTAGFAHQGSAQVVGDPVGGWFWLPPMHFWKPWATEALRANDEASAQRLQFDLRIAPAPIPR